MRKHGYYSRGGRLYQFAEVSTALQLPTGLIISLDYGSQCMRRCRIKADGPQTAKMIGGAPNVSARAMCLLKALEAQKGDILLVVKEEETFADFANAFSSLKSLLAGPLDFEPLFWGSDAALRAQALKSLYSRSSSSAKPLILVV